MANEQQNGSGALHMGRVQPVESVREHLDAALPAGCTLKDAQRPEFWKHYVARLVPGTIVEARCEDGSWFAWLLVMFVSETGAEMEVLWSKEFDQTERKSETPTHEIKWISPSKKWAVVHKASGKVLQDEFYPKKKAQQFMATL